MFENGTSAYVHAFAGLGNLICYSDHGSVPDRATALFKQIRLSLGLGVLLRMAGFTLEFNFAPVFRNLQYDDVKKSPFEFGIGARFP